jgi:hypothetical protein
MIILTVTLFFELHKRDSFIIPNGVNDPPMAKMEEVFLLFYESCVWVFFFFKKKNSDSFIWLSLLTTTSILELKNIQTFWEKRQSLASLGRSFCNLIKLVFFFFFLKKKIIYFKVHVFLQPIIQLTMAPLNFQL